MAKKKSTAKRTKKPAKAAAPKPEVTSQGPDMHAFEELFYSSLANRIRPISLLQEQAMLDLRRRQQKIKRVAGIVVIAGLLAAGILLLGHTPSVVPKPVASSVDFAVYYPEPKKLPKGYVLDSDSFANPVKNGVTYSVNYSGSKKVVFSVQSKPSDTELQTFNSNYIPLRIDYKTNLGQAEIGAYRSQTLVSLPVDNGPWVIITAPADINPSDLKQIILAIRKA